MANINSTKYAKTYRRISSHNQVGNNSLNTQEQAIKQYAKEHNIKIVGDYVDVAKSGTSVKNRSGYQQMIKFKYDVNIKQFRKILFISELFYIY